MSNAGYSLECDDLSSVSSLSSNDHIVELQMDDLLSIGEQSSDGNLESSCDRIELEDLVANFNDNHRSIAHLRCFGGFGQSVATLEFSFGSLGISDDATLDTIKSDNGSTSASDEMTLDTIHSDDGSAYTSSVGGESMSYEVHHDEEFDDAFEDQGSHIDDSPSSKMLSAPSSRSSLDQTECGSGSSQLVENGPLTAHTSADGDISSGVGSNVCFAENERIERARARRLELVNKRPVTRYTSSNGNISPSGAGSNPCFAENERIERARARRFEALKRYESVLKHTSTLNVDDQISSQHEESLNKQVTENIDPTSSFQKTTLASRGNSISELRSRQHKSLNDLISAFDKLRHSTAVTACQRQPPPATRSWSKNPWGRWNWR